MPDNPGTIAHSARHSASVRATRLIQSSSPAQRQTPCGAWRVEALPIGFGDAPSWVATSGSAMVHSIASIIEKSTRATPPSCWRCQSAAAATKASIRPHIGSHQAKPTRGAMSG